MRDVQLHEPVRLVELQQADAEHAADLEPPRGVRHAERRHRALRGHDLHGVADERAELLRQLAADDDGRQLALRGSRATSRLPVCIDLPICVTSDSSFGSIPLMVMKALRVRAADHAGTGDDGRGADHPRHLLQLRDFGVVVLQRRRPA